MGPRLLEELTEMKGGGKVFKQVTRQLTLGQDELAGRAESVGTSGPVLARKGDCFKRFRRQTGGCTPPCDAETSLSGH